ncbi:MAG: hypothetical protein WAQ52_00330 [Terriglobales bacterium]
MIPLPDARLQETCARFEQGFGKKFFVRRQVFTNRKRLGTLETKRSGVMVHSTFIMPLRFVFREGEPLNTPCSLSIYRLSYMEGESFETLPDSSMVANTTPETETGGLEHLQESVASPEAREAAGINFSPENDLKNLEDKTRAGEQEITHLTELVEKSKTELNRLREQMGLPPTEDDPPGLASEARKLHKLQVEQEALAMQKAELLRQERERLIREEKQRILQEKIDDLFREFETLDMPDFESLFATGRNNNGGPWESSALGLLDPEMVKSLAKAFKEGIKLLPQILETLPGLLKQFDEQLTGEAEERVDQQLEQEQKAEEKEEQKNEAPELEEQTEMSEEEPAAGNVSDEPKVDETVPT